MKEMQKKDECQECNKKLTHRLAKLSLKKNPKRKFKMLKRLSYKMTPHNTSQYLIANYKRNLSQTEQVEQFPTGSMKNHCAMGVFLTDTHPFEDFSFFPLL